MDIRYDDGDLPVDAFLALAGRVWPRPYDRARAAAALARTANVGAWDGDRLVGAVRVLTDGYFFATVPEVLVDPGHGGPSPRGGGGPDSGLDSRVRGNDAR